MSAMKRSSILILSLVFAATAAQAANGPKVSPNVRVNDPQKAFPEDNPSRNTATLAASENGFQILAGWDDFQGFCGEPNNLACPAQEPPGLTGYGFSLNGGHTWTDAGSPAPIDGVWTAGHPWADRGTENGLDTFYLTSRMRDSALFTTSAGIGIYRGHFTHDGFAWEDSQIINSPNPNDYYSRQSIAAAKDNSGAAYIALSNIDEICDVPAAGFGQIEVWRTHDAGLTWNGPVVVSPDTVSPSDPADPLCGATGTQQVIPVVSIGPGGQVYVVWQYGPFSDAVAGTTATKSKLAFSRSLDGGVTFSEPSLIVEYNNNRSNAPVGYAKNRLNDQPRMAVATSGRYKGRIYVTFYAPVQEVTGAITAQSNVSSQIYLIWSDNQGRTWSDPKVLAGEVPDTGVKRFWPTPTVRPNGDLDVVYMESQETQVTADPADIECSVPVSATAFRKGPLSSLVDTWWIQSRDGGATFSAPVRVSSETSNWCQATAGFMSGLYSANGDYLGIASAPNRTLVAWPDNRDGAFVDIFFATVKGTAKP